MNADRRVSMDASNAAVAPSDDELTRLRQEVAELREYRSATAAVLGVISRSPKELQPVLEAIVDTAVRLCDAELTYIRLLRDGLYHFAAGNNTNSHLVSFLRENPVPPGRDSLNGKVALEGRTIHIPDVLADDEDMLARRFGSPSRTMLGVPLLLDGTVVGVIILTRKDVRPFADREIALVETFADQAVIAIENARLFEAEQMRTRELSESLEYQTAISDVLEAMSRSPSTIQPVFDTIVATATRLCHGDRTILRRRHGEVYEVVSTHGLSEAQRHNLMRYPLTADRGSIFGRAVLEGRTVHLPDTLADPEFGRRDAPVTLGIRSGVAVPLMRNGGVFGVITVTREKAEAFQPRQIQLLETFAHQAVIAINNVGLFEQVQARTKELQDSLEYQTASSEVLGVISRSKFDLEPVLNSVVATAVRLCRAHQAMIYLLQDGFYRYAAGYGDFDPSYIEIERNEAIPAGGGTLVGRVALAGEAVRIEDAMADAKYAKKDDALIGRIRSMLGVPLLRDEAVIGVIGLARKHVEPFEAREIELVTTFANQAVIAIENARLFEELQTRQSELTETLEYQTATTEVLKVVSRSTFDLEPVLQSVVETANRLCQADMASIFQLDGDVYRWRVGHGLDKAYEDIERITPITADDKTLVGRIALSGSTLHVEDAWTDADYGPKDAAKIGNVRTMLGVPLMRSGKVIGIIALARARVELFTQRQIDLVRTFADQAVIAIENARLLTEVQQRSTELARTVSDLKALSEIGQVVSSTLDPKTVLSTVVDRAVQLAAADAGVVFHFNEADQTFGLVETIGLDAATAAAYQAGRLAAGSSGIGEAIKMRRTVQFSDLAARPANPLRDGALAGGFNAVLIVPLIAANRLLGTLTILRRRSGAFAAGVVGMMESFASQSAIAIQNARLFDEIAEKGRQIEIASQHKSQFLANMSHELRTPLNAILGYTELLVDGTYGALAEKPKGILERVERNGRHLLGLINDVLDLSKIEAGEMTLTIEDYSWGSLVRNVVAATEPLASQKGLKLETEIAEGMPRGLGDARRLNQVLLNLVGNAIKFTDTGFVRIAVRAEAGNFDISVTDTGPGIAPEDQAKVFEKFQQIDNSSTRKKGGSGLGLSISRELVERHGGKITVASDLGRGATFRIVLPCRLEMPREATA